MKDYAEYQAAVEQKFAAVVDEVTQEFLAARLEYTKEEFLPLLPKLSWPKKVDVKAYTEAQIQEVAVEAPSPVGPDEAPVTEDVADEKPHVHKHSHKNHK